jgi:hypothetical protein
VDGLLLVAMKRPYINSTITDLESIFHANCKDRDILKSLKDELMLRSSNRAQALRDNVDKLLEHPMNVTEKTSAPTSALLARLKPLREKLIDVSLRSRLLNYRDLGSQTLPLRPCDLDTLYQWLVASEKELEVEGVPKGESKDDSTEPPADEAQPPPTRLSVDFSGEDATQDVEDGTLRSRDSMLKTENRMTALFRKYRSAWTPSVAISASWRLGSSNGQTQNDKTMRNAMPHSFWCQWHCQK